MDDVILIADLKVLFDIAIESMDFGSGFLDHDEVLVLRRIAVFLGVDPKTATPDNFRASFAHDVVDPRERDRVKFVPFSENISDNRRLYSNRYEVVGKMTICSYCRREVDNPVHHGVSVVEPTSTYEP